ncbi:hypothetical protein A2765_03020 [Candidatus Kaiserbacteria bacterium RIFCSPHIGHO2_01_FULL_56_24]|uniref:Uncharacterized protein n=1 Tax=Candidatus Kaiserbacteria bacterium RIFCSPHIGHO2_01_FULL_56_24 TaxID=1798487 RepID=A0A1F6DG54_9BACT|nr:MAG: hypothetical protein A2765_03020 [Candidatus Kaiserbacteria bacterium RIFCSPHIGHO2_01_FULL_56_24]
MTDSTTIRMWRIILVLLIGAWGHPAAAAETEPFWVSPTQFEWLVQHALRHGTVTYEHGVYRTYRLRRMNMYGDVACEGERPLSFRQVEVDLPVGSDRNDAMIRVMFNGPLHYETKEAGKVVLINTDWFVSASRKRSLAIEPSGTYYPGMRIGEHWYAPSGTEAEAASSLCMFIESEKQRLVEEAWMRDFERKRGTKN